MILAAPKESRGSVTGAAAILGNLGVLFVSKVGGSIYRYNPAYPFV
jgi:nitrate/nitrite transporter NarK